MAKNKGGGKSQPHAAPMPNSVLGPDSGKPVPKDKTVSAPGTGETPGKQDWVGG